MYGVTHHITYGKWKSFRSCCLIFVSGFVRDESVFLSSQANIQRIQIETPV